MGFVIKKKTRKYISKKRQADILTKSRRRCCLCVYLSGDQRQKKVQIAHINNNPEDNATENLVPLCFDHHVEYHAKTPLSKGITTHELKGYRDRLFTEIEVGTLRFDGTNLQKDVTVKSVNLKVLPFDQTQYDIIDRLSKSYLERLDISDRVQRFLRGPGGCLVITGEPGGGKSTFAANLILSKTRADGNVAFHFIESTRRGWKRMIAALLYQLEEKFSPHLEQSMEISDESFEDEYIIQNYRMRLSAINKIMKSKNQSLLIVIDALDELISSPLDPSVKNLFEFIPSAPDFLHIHFIVTTRLGDVYDQFKYHMGVNLTDEFDIGHFGSSEISELCVLYGINLSHGDRERLLSVSGGNPLYLSVIFKEIMKDKTFDIGSLPRNIVYFFRSDLINKHNIEADTLLREFLAVMLILREQLSDVALSQILGLSTVKEFRKKILTRISSYLSCSTEMTYSFFHKKFAESLTETENPVIDQQDLFAAHQKVIGWCEPLETLPEEGKRFQYAFQYLPYHYWSIGASDGFSGFINLLGRGNMNCEIACRSFLREMITLRAQEELFYDNIFKNKVARFFLDGNAFARHCLFRMSDDLSGFGYEQFKRELWTEVISHFPNGSEWFDEIFVNTLSLSGDRLAIALRRINALVKVRSQEEKRYLRRYYHIAGVISCMHDASAEAFDRDKGLKFFMKAIQILEKMSPKDLLPSSCMDLSYAKYHLDHMKGALLNDYSISLRRVGEIDNALNYYRKTLAVYATTLSHVQNTFLKNRTMRSIALTQHNLGHLMMLRANYDDAMDLLSDAIDYRGKHRMMSGFLATLDQITYLFIDLDLYSSRPLRYLGYALQPNVTHNGKIAKCSTYFNYLLAISDWGNAADVLKKLKSLRAEPSSDIRSDHIELFKSCSDGLRLSVGMRADSEALSYVERCLSILHQHGEWKTFFVPGRTYFNFWEAVARGYLLNKEFDMAKDVIFNKIELWLNHYGFTGLLRRFYKLKSLYFEQIGDNEEAAKFLGMTDEVAEQRIKTIAKKKLSTEAIDYLDYLVESNTDPRLPSIYEEIRPRLAHGFVNNT